MGVGVEGGARVGRRGGRSSDVIAELARQRTKMMDANRPHPTFASEAIGDGRNGWRKVITGQL